MLQTVIVDDEIPVSNLLKMFLEKTKQAKVLGTFSDPLEAVNKINIIKPDVVFLDIEMPEMNGIELASRLIEQDDELMIVFVTGYNRYALEAFQVNALDYILKPINQNTIEKCISRLIKLKGLGNVEKFKREEKRIRCFGSFEVYGNNGLVNFPTRKVEELLAYFIVHRDTIIEGWQLGEILWGEEEPKKVKVNLHTTLFRLRKTIKEEKLSIEIHSIKGGKGLYHCSIDSLACDLIEFEEGLKENSTVDETNIIKLEKICELYKEDLFSTKYYEWCESKREMIKIKYLNLLRNIFGYYFEKGMYQKSIDRLLEATRISPFDEDIIRKLLKLYNIQKNRAMIIKCYEQFSRRLIEEIGVNPQTETRSLFLQLVNE